MNYDVFLELRENKCNTLNRESVVKKCEIVTTDNPRFERDVRPNYEKKPK